jgi:hypothetical protein
MEVYCENSKKLLMLNITNTGSSSRIETCRLFMGYKHKEQWYIKEKHSTLNDLKNIINLDEYYIITFVRNPYDRVLSQFVRTYVKNNNISIDDFNILLKKYINDGEWKKLKLQSNILKINNVVVDINRICYYENMNKYWYEICKECNLPRDSLKILNPKNMNNDSMYLNDDYAKNSNFRFDKRGNYNLYLNKEQKEKIYNYFREDFDLFKYDNDL